MARRMTPHFQGKNIKQVGDKRNDPAYKVRREIYMRENSELIHEQPTQLDGDRPGPFTVIPLREAEERTSSSGSEHDGATAANEPAVEYNLPTISIQEATLIQQSFNEWRSNICESAIGFSALPDNCNESIKELCNTMVQFLVYVSDAGDTVPVEHINHVYAQVTSYITDEPTQAHHTRTTPGRKISTQER